MDQKGLMESIASGHIAKGALSSPRVGIRLWQPEEVHSDDDGARKDKANAPAESAAGNE